MHWRSHSKHANHLMKAWGRNKPINNPLSKLGEFDTFFFCQVKRTVVAAFKLSVFFNLNTNLYVILFVFIWNDSIQSQLSFYPLNYQTSINRTGLNIFFVVLSFEPNWHVGKNGNWHSNVFSLGEWNWWCILMLLAFFSHIFFSSVTFWHCEFISVHYFCFHLHFEFDDCIPTDSTSIVKSQNDMIPKWTTKIILILISFPFIEMSIDFVVASVRFKRWI